MLDAIFPRLRNGIWVTREEVQNVVTHAKTFKSPYTRKCPQRPFENFISLLALFPWANHSVYAPAQVESLFHGYTALISILQWHIRKGKITGLNTTLLRRLVIAGTNLTDFSSAQKRTVCHAVGFYPQINCTLANTPASNFQADKEERRHDDDNLHQHSTPQAHPSSNQPSTSLPAIWINDCRTADIQAISEPIRGASKAFRTPTEPYLGVYGSSLKSGDTSFDTDLSESLNILISSASRSLMSNSLETSSSVSQTASLENAGGAYQGHSEKPLCALTPQQQWLLNARRAGIAVKLPLPCSNRA